ncbi:UV excision repair protein [Rutstroemia sp. NJR-2017a WRK4]|nr:UV excision repair protein [Rutstroemia sp. NJR-2017a WRK4]
MTASKVLPLSLGFLALASDTVMLIFNIILSTTASKHHPPSSASISSYVASAFSFVTVAFLLLLVIRQIRYQNHIQDSGMGRLRIYLFAGVTSIFTILSAVTTAISLALMRRDFSLLPAKVISSDAPRFTMGAFVVWAISLASQVVFLISIVLIQRKDFHQQIQPYVTESERHSSSEMQEKTRTEKNSMDDEFGYSRNYSMESKNASSFGGSSRANTLGSVRSSLSHVVRPMTSKTRLVHSTSQRSSNFRPPSLDSTFCETIVSTEEDFDSWNTSGVDAQSREVIESASPSLPRFLETIPASPVGSRSPSPACPSDLSELEPPTRPRSRSYSPANSIRSVRTFAQPRITSFDSDSEAHIHPLFRSDSPGPAPAATPGTIVTAAPGAGTILSDVHSIRSVSRLRSESLTSIPRAQSPSLESLRRAIAEEERETVQTEEAERSLTPPIPEWIMGAGARSSMSEYNKKKARSIGKAGGRAGESMDY